MGIATIEEKGTMAMRGIPTADLSVVIVSWNVADLLVKCLESLIADAKGLSLEVFIVDNASKDDTLNKLRQFPQFRVIANEVNVGFARANNQVFKDVTGRFVLILNPDTVVIEGALRKMIEFLVNHPDVGMVGPRLCYPNDEVQATCARPFVTLAMSLFYALRLLQLPFIGRLLSKQYLFPYDLSISQCVEAISGAAMMIRREIIQKLGGFGDTFLHGGEDLDLCFRIQKSGWKTYYLSDAKIIHFEGQSAKQVSVRTVVNTVLSTQEYFNRCYGTWHGVMYRLIAQFVQAPTLISVSLVKWLLRRESSHELQQRIAMAKAIWVWQKVS